MTEVVIPDEQELQTDDHDQVQLQHILHLRDLHMQDQKEFQIRDVVSCDSVQEQEILKMIRLQRHKLRITIIKIW